MSERTMRGKTLVEGHALEFEGRAHTQPGCCTLTYSQTYSTAGPGHGKCSCGLLSPHLASGYQRRKWHKDHKADVLKERA